MFKNYRNGYVFLIALCLCCLLPFFFLSFFNHPAADDFTMTFTLERLKFWGAQKYWYMGWTGRYVSTAVFSLFHPLLYKSFLLYKVYPPLIFLFMGSSIYYFISAVVRNTRIEVKLALSSVIFLTYISTLPSMVEGFYWVPGSFIYTLGNVATLYFASFLLNFDATKKRSYFLFSLLAGIYAIGSNELNLFIVLFCAGIWGLEQVLATKKLSAHLIVMMGILLLAAGFSLLAPGNSGRAATINLITANEGYHVKDFAFACRQSFINASHDFLKFIFWGPLVILTLLSILYSKHLQPNIRFTLHPGLVGFGLIAVFVFLYFPFYYGTGNPDISSLPGRTRNVLSFFFIFSWLGWIVYSLNWFTAKKGKALFTYENPLVFRLLVAVFTVVILATGNVKAALKDIRSRDFLAYNQEMNNRYTLISQTAEDSLVVDSLRFFPRTIYFGDITAEFDNWKNGPYASYFGKKAIRLKSTQDSETKP